MHWGMDAQGTAWIPKWTRVSGPEWMLGEILFAPAWVLMDIYLLVLSGA